ncbi:MAG: enoyl-CoA hydratase [Actinomycetia bacterium]|nr:enoyl-CoA hydratase [Actinomycetes bacterium]
MAPTDVLEIDIADRVATLTMNRPEARNALNRELRAAIPAAMAEADGSDEVDVIILTGTDPAFCAGLDLRELGAGANPISGESGDLIGRPWSITTKPVIGAVNGPAITGGFELGLNCDFLIASDRARFADTHARVGVMPGWGLTVLLPQAIGVRRARELSLTGNFLDAPTAAAWGLVNRVVDHDQLLPTARALAADISGNDQRGVARMLETYRAVAGTTVNEGWRVEARMGSEWAQGGIDPASIEARRQAIVDRGRSQL